MSKKRIVCCLLAATLTAPLIQVNSLQLNSETEQLTENVEVLDLRNYEFNEMQKKLDVELEKIKAEQLRIKQEQERLAEEERLRQEELEKQRIAEEERKRNENRIYCKFEVSFYCGCYDCTQNGNLQTASGEYAVEGITIAAPSDIPFGSQVYIEELRQTYTVQDRGGYIEYTYDEYGNLVMRLDVYISDHNRALEYGRFYSEGYIDLNVE